MVGCMGHWDIAPDSYSREERSKANEQAGAWNDLQAARVKWVVVMCDLA